MAAEPPPEERAESKAVSALRDAERSLCPHCGRITRTVSGGICADCWGVKDPENALVLRPELRTEPLLGWDGLDGWLGDLPWLPLLGAAVAVLVALVALWIT